MKKLLLTIALFLSLPLAAFAIPSSVDRVTDHIEPLIKTDFIRGTNFVATTTNTNTLPVINGTSLTGFGLVTCNGSQFLQYATGVFACGTPSGGGGGGTDVNWSYFNNSGIRPATTTNTVLIGGSATTTALAKLQVIGGIFTDKATTTSLYITGLALPAGTFLAIDPNGQVIATTTPSGGGGVTSVTGTANRITSTGGATPVIDISGSYVGQSSITTLGTISTGAIPASLVTNGTFGTGNYVYPANLTVTSLFTATNASTTLFSTSYGSTTNAFLGTLNLPNITGTQCLHSVSGVVSGTGSDCGSGGGGGTNFLTNVSTNTFLNTGTNLQAPVLQATSTTASSTIVLALGVGTTSAPATLTVGGDATTTNRAFSKLLLGSNSLTGVAGGEYIGINARNDFAGDYLRFEHGGAVDFELNNSNVPVGGATSMFLTGNIFAGAGILTGAGFGISVGAGGVQFAQGAATQILDPGGVNGLLELVDITGTTFTRLDLGGTTSSFPAISRNGTGIQFRLADNSGNASTTVKSEGAGTTTDTALFAAQGTAGQTTNLLNLASSTGATVFRVGSSGAVFMNNLTSSTGQNSVCITPGTGEIVNAGAGTCTLSSKYVKHDIVSMSWEEALNAIIKLKPITYIENDTNTSHVGLIAEDVQKIDPLLVYHANATTTIDGHTFKVGDPIGVDYERSVAVVIKSLQDQGLAILILFGIVVWQGIQIKKLKK